METGAWYESWFDSPYYHILYSHRDGHEAGMFIDNLLERIHIPANSAIMDLGCGKGRHSRHLHERGYRVTGLDLSTENINYCRQFEQPGLEFYVHDMRRLFRINYYDAVVNLFTSFGYFERNHENELVVQAASKSLVKGGYFILDFINVNKAVKDLVPEQKKTVDNIEFCIRKSILNGKIVKDISFTADGKDYNFREEVKMLTLEDFNLFFLNSGLTLLEKYGDYKLGKFDVMNSPRLILLGRKV